MGAIKPGYIFVILGIILVVISSKPKIGTQSSVDVTDCNNFLNTANLQGACWDNSKIIVRYIQATGQCVVWYYTTPCSYVENINNNQILPPYVVTRPLIVNGDGICINEMSQEEKDIIRIEHNDVNPYYLPLKTTDNEYYFHNYNNDVASFKITKNEVKSRFGCLLCNTDADADCNGAISLTEIHSYGQKWLNSQITRTKVGQAIQAWSGG